MGAEIALLFALAGSRVVLKDASLDLAEKGKARLEGVLDKLLKRGKVPAEANAAALQRISPSDDWRPFAEADLVIEAVFEKFSVKQEVFAELNKACKPECLLLTNTSSIPITQLASQVDAQRRGLFLGAHFFSPASIMALVEVIPGLETGEGTVEWVLEICRAIGKTPIKVKDVPGFAVNRIFHVMIIEACRLVEEGVASPEDVDIACRLGLGHPVGPFHLMDLLGNDLTARVQDILFREYGERFRPRPNLKQKVDAGHLGSKAGRGWLLSDRT
jgi:3-hydroxybutyryl-CoA dehydrogenase